MKTSIATFSLPIIICISLVFWNFPALADDHGNSISTATQVLIGSITQGSVETSNDLDYFKFTINEPGTYVFFSRGTFDTKGKLFNSTHTQLALDYNSGEDNNFRLTYKFNTSGDFYIEVSHNSGSGIGNYALHIEGNGAGTLSDDHGFSIWSATTVNIGSITHGNIDLAGDLDYFQFTINQPGIYVFFTRGNSNTTGKLFNATYTELAYVLGGGEGDNFRIAYNFISTGTYYMEVSHNSTAGTGRYDFHLGPAGSIAGHITNEQGIGIADIDVKVYSIPRQCLIASDKTDVNGYYNIIGINEGLYRVYVDDNIPKLYLSEWWDNQTSFSKGNIAQVRNGQTTTVDGQLTLGGIITGKVTNRSNLGLNNVAVYRKDINSNSGASSVSTNASGIYTMRQLPPGAYKIYFNGANAGYNLRYWNDKGTLAEADPVTVSSGMTAPDINGQLDLAGSISGKVTNLSGAGIANVWVNAYDLIKQSINSEATNSTGEYTIIGIPTGNYKIWFDTRSAGNYIEEWYDNQTAFEASTPISVINGMNTPNINAQLNPGGSISGKVTNQNGVGLSGITVWVYTLTHEGINADLTDTNGDYIVSALPTGSYKVQFSGYSSCSTDTCYMSEWYDDQHSFAAANPVAVTVNNITSNINAVLSNCPDKFVYLPLMLK